MTQITTWSCFIENRTRILFVTGRRMYGSPFMMTALEQAESYAE
ncbi:MAG: hypothetical protein ABF611_10465 [Acetobacter orientalis]